MANMAELRRVYGSAVLEQFNSMIFSYRRNVAASITLSLFVVHEALTTKLALPQFLPSARLAHLRMIVRIRQILIENTQEESKLLDSRTDTDSLARKREKRLNFLAWNAS